MTSNLQNSSHYIPDKYPVELNGLGQPVAVFWTSFTPLLWAWLLGIIIAITSIPFLLGGNYIIGVLLLICAIAIVANQFRKEVWLALSDEGLVHLANKQLTTIYWKDIIYTYQKGQKNQVTLFFIPLIRITHREFKIVTKSLQTIDITSLLAYPDRAWTLIQQKVTSLLLPEALDKLSKGESLTFGDFKLSKEGIKGSTQQLRWDEIRGIKAENGIVHVNSKKDRWVSWGTTPFEDVANPMLFFVIVNAYLSTPNETELS